MRWRWKKEWKRKKVLRNKIDNILEKSVGGAAFFIKAALVFRLKPIDGMGMSGKFPSEF